MAVENKEALCRTKSALQNWVPEPTLFVKQKSSMRSKLSFQQSSTRLSFWSKDVLELCYEWQTSFLLTRCHPNFLSTTYIFQYSFLHILAKKQKRQNRACMKREDFLVVTWSAEETRATSVLTQLQFTAWLQTSPRTRLGSSSFLQSATPVFSAREKPINKQNRNHSQCLRAATL